MVLELLDLLRIMNRVIEEYLSDQGWGFVVLIGVPNRRNSSPYQADECLQAAIPHRYLHVYFHGDEYCCPRGLDSRAMGDHDPRWEFAGLFPETGCLDHSQLDLLDLNKATGWYLDDQGWGYEASEDWLETRFQQSPLQSDQGSSLSALHNQMVMNCDDDVGDSEELGEYGRVVDLAYQDHPPHPEAPSQRDRYAQVHLRSSPFLASIHLYILTAGVWNWSIRAVEQPVHKIWLRLWPDVASDLAVTQHMQCIIRLRDTMQLLGTRQSRLD